MKFRCLAVAAVVFVLAGCSATIKRDSAELATVAIPPSAGSKLVLNVSGAPSQVAEEDWKDFQQEWVDNFTEQAAIAQVQFEVQQGATKPTGEDGVLLSVYVDDYRFLRPGTRYAVGVMAGNAFIESKLTYLDLKTGQTYGTQTANTSSSAWQGIFSAMTNKQIEAIAVDVLKQMKAAKK